MQNAIIELKDGTYQADVVLEGGSGRASITSPARMEVSDGQATVQIEWSSPNFDYMKLDGITYDPVNTEENSVFELPVKAFDEPVEVIADTVAMSEPHEVSYTIMVDSTTITGSNAGSLPAAFCGIAGCLIIAGVLMYRRKRRSHEAA